MTAAGASTIEVRVLGPIEVVAGGEVLPLGSPKQRALLAALVMSANRVVAVDRLVEELWGDEPPPRAMASLQAYVSRLRRLLQPGAARRGRSDVLVTRPPGYLLAVAHYERGAAVARELGLVVFARRAEAALAALRAPAVEA